MEILAIVIGVVKSVLALALFARSKAGAFDAAVSEDREIAFSDEDRRQDQTVVDRRSSSGERSRVSPVSSGGSRSKRCNPRWVSSTRHHRVHRRGSRRDRQRHRGRPVGGLMIGVLSSVAPFLLLDGFHVPSLFPAEGRDRFLILVLVLIFRPTGLFGGKDREKV